MTNNYRGMTNDQVHILPRYLHFRKCHKCQGSLKFISSDGKENMWSCDKGCGLFSVRVLISAEEKTETAIWQKHLWLQKMIKNNKKVIVQEKKDKQAFKKCWRARAKLQRQGLLK